MQKRKTLPAGDSSEIAQKIAGQFEEISIPNTNLDAIEEAEERERRAKKKREASPCGCGRW